MRLEHIGLCLLSISLTVLAEDGGMGHMDHNTMGNMAKDNSSEKNMSSMTPPSGAHHVQAHFFLSTEAVILFEEWIADSDATFIGSCVGIAMLAVLYEGLKLCREMLRSKEMRNRYSASKSCCTTTCYCLHLLQTILHMIQFFISYCLMLVFMLFNGWLCISIVGGAGLGYLIFGWKKRTIDSASDNEHCY